MSMLLHCTDFHGRRAWFDWLEVNASRYDAVVLSGDLLDAFLTGEKQARQIDQVRAFLAGFQHPLFVTSGNHDEALGLEELAANARGRINVDGYSGTHFGFRVFCAGWRRTPLWLDGDQDGPVLLISHQPPSGTAVSRDCAGDWGGHDVRALSETLPAGSLVLSGHVHAPERWHTRVGAATALNPGVAYATSPAPRHVVIDSDRKRARLMGRSAGEDELVRF